MSNKFDNMKKEFKELPKSKQNVIIFGYVFSVFMIGYGIYSLIQQKYGYGIMYMLFALFYIFWIPRSTKKVHNQARKEVLDDIVQKKIDVDTLAKEKVQREKEEQAKKEWETRERRMRCNVCGHVFCYSAEDIKNNQREAGLALLTSIGSVASVVGGTKYDMYEQGKLSNKHSSRIKDLSHCPNCNSADIVEIGPNAIIANPNNSQQAQQTSTADELRKYKELLDMGAITQEEFEAKKKELLNL